MQIYIVEAGMKLSKAGGKVNITTKDNCVKSYPIEIIDSVVLNKNVQITSQCLADLATRGVKISWLNNNGKLIGSLINPYKQDISCQQQQYYLTDKEYFRLEMARKFIFGKISNQKTLLSKKVSDNKEPFINELKKILNKIVNCKGIEEMMGLEGIAARIYYQGLRSILPVDYGFVKRIKNPPLDMVNSVMSFLYTMLFNDIFLAVHNCGCNPYLGIMHKCRQGHPALVSDLMEEWRSMVADVVAIRFLTHYDLEITDFSIGDNGGLYLVGEAKKVLIKYYEEKVESSCFFHKEGMKDTYRGAFITQLQYFKKVLTTGNPQEYKMIIAR